MAADRGHRQEFHVYLHVEPASVTQPLDPILTQLRALVAQVTSMDTATQQKLDALSLAVAKGTSIEQSVKTLLEGLSAQIAALKTGVSDPAVLAALDQATSLLEANTARFAADVAANTQP